MDGQREGPGVAGIAEAVLYVPRLADVRGFYEDVLGLAVLHANERAAVFRAGAGQVLIVFDRRTAWSERTTPGGTIPAVVAGDAQGPGRSHVAFSIPSGSLEGWRERLSAHGVPMESRVVWGEGVESLYFRDPAGHLLELVTPGLWGE